VSKLINKLRSLPYYFRLFLVLSIVSFIFYSFWFILDRYNNQPLQEKSEVNGISKQKKLAEEIFEEYNYDPNNYIYEELSILELPIYPPAWVRSYFGENTSKDISGENGDPDGDGLINKLEYIYGSSPINPDTLCNSKIDKKKCLGRNDKENVDLNISPLTGQVITLPKKITLNRQDTKVLSRIQNNFNRASEEGVDFPTLYQLSANLDLNAELLSIPIIVANKDTIDSVQKYNELRAKVIDEFLVTDELSGISNLYSIKSLTTLNQQIQNYTAILETLKKAPVPKKYSLNHKQLILLFQKIIKLINHRITGVSKENFDKDYKDKSRQIATEIVWIYRNINQL
jgi:hypothetical protein